MLSLLFLADCDKTEGKDRSSLLVPGTVGCCICRSAQKNKKGEHHPTNEIGTLPQLPQQEQSTITEQAQIIQIIEMLWTKNRRQRKLICFDDDGVSYFKTIVMIERAGTAERRT
jgi:hypothetical protein